MSVKTQSPFTATSEIAKQVAASLCGGFQPLIVGNVVVVPKCGIRIEELAEVSETDPELWFDLDEFYYAIDCPVD